MNCNVVSELKECPLISIKNNIEERNYYGGVDYDKDNDMVNIKIDYFKTDSFVFSVSDIKDFNVSNEIVTLKLNNGVAIIATKAKRVDISSDDIFTQDTKSLVYQTADDVEIINFHYIKLSTKALLEIEKMTSKKLGIGRWMIDSFGKTPITLYRKKSQKHGFLFGLWDIENRKCLTPERIPLK